MHPQADAEAQIVEFGKGEDEEEAGRECRYRLSARSGAHAV